MLRLLLLSSFLGCIYCYLNCLFNEKDLTEVVAQKWTQAFPKSLEIQYCSLMIPEKNQETLLRAFRTDNSSIQALVDRVATLDRSFHQKLKNLLQNYEQIANNLVSSTAKELVTKTFDLSFYAMVNDGVTLILNDPKQSAQFFEFISKGERVAELASILEKPEKQKDFEEFATKFPLLADKLISKPLPSQLKQKFDAANIKNVTFNKPPVLKSNKKN